MKQLILGGARSGKSTYAQGLAEQSRQDVIYLATATAGDAEMAARIKQHQTNRPAHWQVIEEPVALAQVLQQQAAEDVCILVDCLTLWLSNLLARGDEILAQQKTALLHGLATVPGHIIFVSNEVGMGIIPMGELSRRFVDEAGFLHQQLAQACDTVTLMVAGLPYQIKPHADQTNRVK